MTPSTVATWALNGTKVEFDVPFDYLSRTFVQVTLIGTTNRELTIGNDFQFITPTRIQLFQVYGPPDFNLIEIRRNTSTTERLVEFHDASILTASDMNTADLQVLHVAEEARNAATESIGVNNDGHLDARGRRIVNLGSPIEPLDAVNKQYVDTAAQGVGQSLRESKEAMEKAKEWATKPTPVEAQLESSKTYSERSGASASASAGSASQSQASAQNSSASAQSASASAGSALNQAGIAEGHKNAAATSAGQSAASASQAAGSVTAAAAEVTKAKQEVTKATAQADRSRTEADRSKLEADRAYTNAQSVDGPYIKDQLENPTNMKSINGGQISNRNVLVNGAMMVSHEGPGSIEAGKGEHYAVDCFEAVGILTSPRRVEASPMSNASVDGLTNFLRLRSTNFGPVTSGEHVSIVTPLEGYNVRRLIGKTFTLSFYVRGTHAGNVWVALRSGKSNRSFLKSVEILPGEAWSRAKVTVPGGIPAQWATDTAVTSLDEGRGLQVVITAASGSAYRAPNGSGAVWLTGNYIAGPGTDSYFTTAGQVLDITGAQLEVGEEATEFEHETFQQCMARVNRYICVIEDVRSLSVPGNSHWNGAVSNVYWPVRMLAPPTIYVSPVPGGESNFDVVPLNSTRSGGSIAPSTDQSGKVGWNRSNVVAKAYPK